MKQFQRAIYALVALVIAVSSVLMFSGVGRAQAATVANPWVRTGGTALADEFGTIMAHGGMQPVTNAAVGSTSGSASLLLGGAGAGLAIGSKGLQLYSKITTGSWDTYTEGINCGSDWVGKAADFVGKAFKFMSFGVGGYSCATAPGAVKTADLPTVDLSNPIVDKAPVPEPPAPAYRIDYTREYQMSSTASYCNRTFQLQVHFTGFDKGGFFMDVTNPNDFPVNTYESATNSCNLDLNNFAVYFDGVANTYLTFATAGIVVAAGETVHGVKFYIRQYDSAFPDSVAGKRLQCIGYDYAYGRHSLENCLGTSPQGTSLVTKGDNSTLDRQISCRVSATDGTHIDAPGDTYSDSSGIPLDSEKWGCNNAWQQTINVGKIPQRVTATSTFPGAVGDPQVLFNQSVTTTAQETVTKSPECMAADGNSSGCVQRLYKRIDGKLRSCADADVWEQCADWSEESQTNPDAYVCRFGSGDVPLSACEMYKPTFKYPRLDAQLHYKTNTDNDTAIDTDGVMADQPDSKNCWSQMISWNPADWVLTPIKCAAIWAFVPTDTNSWRRVGTAWNDTAPAVVVRTLSGGIELPQAGNGCSGPPLDLESVSGGYLAYNGYPLSACDEPMKTMAQRFKLIAQVLLMASTLWMVIRNITAMFNVPPPPAAIQPTLF